MQPKVTPKTTPLEATLEATKISIQFVHKCDLKIYIFKNKDKITRW